VRQGRGKAVNTRVRVSGGGGRARSGQPEGTRRASGEAEALDEKPRSVYEIVTRQMLEQVKEDVKEVKERVNTLLWVVVGAVVMEVVVRVLA
jgi:hypothetical protein